MNNIITPAKRCCSLINKQLTRKCQVYAYDPHKEGDIIENYQFNIMTIGINIPERRNELDEQSVEKIIELIDKFDCDDNIRGAVIHGIGGNFCKGISLPANKNQDDYIERLRKLRKPLFAAVSGYATGFGFALATMCDFRIADNNSIVGVGSSREEFDPYPNLAASRLATCIGYSQALDLILTKKLLSAELAYQYRFFNSLTEIGTALGQCVNMARSIGKFPIQQTMLDKDFIYSKCFEPSRS